MYVCYVYLIKINQSINQCFLNKPEKIGAIQNLISRFSYSDNLAASCEIARCGLCAGLAINRSRIQIPAATLPNSTLGKLFTHMCLCHQAV